MKRTLIHASVTLLAIAMLAGTALAANPHFLFGGPDFEVDGNVVTAEGSIAGVGNEDIAIELIVEASATVLCRNPGGKIAPGQTKFFEGSAVETGLQPENGRVNFEISVTASPTEEDLAGSCPNARWTPEADEITIHSATLNVYQPDVVDPANLVLQATYPE